MTADTGDGQSAESDENDARKKKVARMKESVNICDKKLSLLGFKISVRHL